MRERAGSSAGGPPGNPRAAASRERATLARYIYTPSSTIHVSSTHDNVISYMHYNIATSASLCASAAVNCATCSWQPIVGSSACRIGRLPSAPATALFLYVRTAM